MSTRSEVFTSRWGMLLAMLGMAIGTGNIWRFPRIAASNGGGTFLVAWAVFLLLWSVPLLILEFGMGKGTRRGTIGSFIQTIGPKFAWMGAWVAWVATAIMFYYSVVMGWTIRFFVATVTGAVPAEVPGQFWEAFNSTPQALIFHGIAVALGVFVVSKGVRGIETAARFLIPSLVILVVVLAIKALTMPGAMAGLAFLFTPDFSALGDVEIWLQALTQNAWDTGAGWGLVLSYAIYMRSREDTALNAFVIGFGNNSMSLLAGIMVLCTIFSVMPGGGHRDRGGRQRRAHLHLGAAALRPDPGRAVLHGTVLPRAGLCGVVQPGGDDRARVAHPHRPGADPAPRDHDRRLGGLPAGHSVGAPDRHLPEPGLGVGRRPHAVGLLLRLRGAQVRRDQVAREVHQHAGLRCADRIGGGTGPCVW